MVRIAIDSVAKGYASHEQAAALVGLKTESWKQYYAKFQEGNLERIPEIIKAFAAARDLRYLTGFSDEQLNILAQALGSSLQQQLEYFLWRVLVAWDRQEKLEKLASAAETRCCQV